MDNAKWRFPTNGYGVENGLDTSDMETFKKDPMSSLAREICQNSIDAQNPDCDKPVRVEFSTFDVPRRAIPGIEALAEQIHACYDYKKDSTQEGQALEKLVESVDRDTITCMRISDFNTTGITGVESSSKDTPFYKITKGSGVSDKAVSSGGSKGIGKFASFVVSSTNTVFYSTRTIDGYCGHIGICKLRSVPTVEDARLMTTGSGFYGVEEWNDPLSYELSLDPSFHRNEDQSGTDVYLIGFSAESHIDWQKEIVAKTLESFMVAILRGKLEVNVDGIEISKDTVSSIVSAADFDSYSKPKAIKGIRAQFELLNGGEDVIVDTFSVDDEEITIYMKEYRQNEASKATKQCVMVRYPYMKIMHTTTGAILPFSALCVIEEGEVNNRLRKIENPQHTDWEINRLNNYPDEKRLVRKTLKGLTNGARDYIIERLRDSSGESTDIVGAGEYLPSQDDLGESKGETISGDKPVVTPIRFSKVRVPKTVKTGENGSSLDFGEGEGSGEGEEGRVPDKGHGNPNLTPHSEDTGEAHVGEGQGQVLKKTSLNGMKFTNVALDGRRGKYACIFTSEFDEDLCDFSLRMCGEGRDKFPVAIKEARVNGVTHAVDNGTVIGVTLRKGQDYRIEYTVESNELFSSEVIMNAYR